MNKKTSIQNLIGRVADRLALRNDSSALFAEEEARPLVIEALEPRILFSGSPAPAPEAAPAEAPAVQEAPAPEAAPATEAAPAEDAAVAAPPEATVPAPDGAADQGAAAVALTDAELSDLTAAASDIWAGSGISEEQGAALASATYQIADLSAAGSYIIGSAEGNVITIDDDGAGRGWFIDDTPQDGADVAASTGIDLLSVLLHEQGHLLGLEDSGAAAGDVMFHVFGEGERRLPADGQAEGAVAGSLEGVHFATVSIFSEDFNGYTGNQNSTQSDTGLEVAHTGTVAGWSRSGSGTIHAVDLNNLGGQSNPSDWAVMFYQNNVITQTTGMAANDAGKDYEVAFDYGTGVYAQLSQKTESADSLLVEVLRADNSVLASDIFAPGAWGTGNHNLEGGLQGTLTYTGDGSGNVRLRIGPTAPLNSGNFEGSIDNISVSVVNLSPVEDDDYTSSNPITEDETLNVVAPSVLANDSSANTELFSENFSGITGLTFNGSPSGQVTTAHDLAFGGSLAGWNKAGAGTIHAVDSANTWPGPTTNPPNLGVMIWQDNVITQAAGISGSNDNGTDYSIDFNAGGAVYEVASQVNNGTTDGLKIEVLRASDSAVLHTFTHVPDQPTGVGDLSFEAVNFTYTGDGSGDIKFRIGPANANQGRFQGTIDDLSLSAVGSATITGIQGTNSLTGTSDNGAEVTMNANGTFSYDPTVASATAIQELDDGDVLIDTFTYTVDGEMATVSIKVNGLNDAPVLDPGKVNNFTDVSVSDDTNDGDSVADLLNKSGMNAASDVDDMASPTGIAITATTVTAPGTGKFQYSTNGGTSWTDLPAVSSDSPLLLEDNARVRFVPDGNNLTGGDIKFRAWDQTASVTVPTTLLTEDFDGITGLSFNGSPVGQVTTTHDLGFGGSLAGWSKAGAGTIHAVDTANTWPGPTANPQNLGVMIWQDNVITQNAAIASSNDSGTDYSIDFLAAGAVYEVAGQANNGTTDGLKVEVLRASDSAVLHTFTHVPAPPVGVGDLGLATVNFTYTGDGSGDIKFRIGPDNANQGRFQGTIDDLTLTSSIPIVVGGTGAFSVAEATATVTVAELIKDGNEIVYTPVSGELNTLTVTFDAGTGELVFVDTTGGTIGSGFAGGGTQEVRVAVASGDSLTIETGDMDDKITVGDMGLFDGTLTIMGEEGFDEILLANGASVSLGADEDLLVDGETFRADLDSSVSVLGDGTISVTAAGGVGDFAGLNLRRASLSSEGGGITLTGVGGDTGNTNDGVVLTHGSTVSTGGGGVTVTGTATSTTGANDGISLKGGSDITAGGAGGITLTGTSGGVNSSYGVQLFSGTEVTTAGGDIAIVGSSDAVGSRNAGIYTNGATVTAGGAGSVAMTGTGGGAGSNNNGLSLAATAVDAGTSGDVTLVGMGGGGTSGNGGVQVGTRTSVSAGGGNVTITGTGGAGTGVRNTGVSLLSGSSVSSGVATSITGVAGTGTSRNGGVVLTSATVAAAGDLTVDGTGNGTGSNNSGISSSRSTLGGAEVTLAGTGSTSSTAGRFNDGVSISRGGVTATGTLTIDAAGGTGSRDNRGLMVSRAALGGTLAVTGSADPGSGSRSTGVFIQNSVLSDDGTIEGTGGAAGLGVYMRNITGGNALGVTTTPDTDDEKRGNFFDAVLPAFLLLGAGGRTKARRGAVGASVLDDELQGRIGAAWGGIRGEARTADALRTQSRLGASLLG